METPGGEDEECSSAHGTETIEGQTHFNFRRCMYLEALAFILGSWLYAFFFVRYSVAFVAVEIIMNFQGGAWWFVVCAGLCLCDFTFTGTEAAACDILCW